MSRLTCLLPLLLAGCMLGNAGASKRLTDAVNQIDKTTRWGQVAEAARMTSPEYRSRFIEKHAGWGQRIQLGDSEVVQVEMAHDGASAVAVLAYQWYLEDAMNLHQTVVRQQWIRTGSAFTLLSETIVQGDPRLFKGGEGPEPAAAASYD